MLHCSWDMVRDRCNCYFTFWAVFCPFTRLTARKRKILKKWKKHLEMISWYTIPEIWCITDVIIISHFGLVFCPFTFFLFMHDRQSKNSWYCFPKILTENTEKYLLKAWFLPHWYNFLVLSAVIFLDMSSSYLHLFEYIRNMSDEIDQPTFWKLMLQKT